jgi:hypothetical protein
MMVRHRVLAGLAALLAATSVGCASASEPGASAEGTRAPMTARALAAIVQDHLDQQMGGATSARRELDGPRAVGGIGAEVSFPLKGESSTPNISVSIGDKASATAFTCKHLAADSYSGCVDIDGGTLFWESETPDEDPGVVYVALRKGDATVLMFQSGPPISKDPRTLDLRISVADMFDIAKDPRVNLTTTAATIRSGQKLNTWTDKP